MTVAMAVQVAAHGVVIRRVARSFRAVTERRVHLVRVTAVVTVPVRLLVALVVAVAAGSVLLAFRG